MSDVHEHLEHAEHVEHAAHSNKKIALVIAVLALFLAFSETLGKRTNRGAEPEYRSLGPVEFLSGQDHPPDGAADRR